jgi:pimeloyl-ACP methyl ester carboxylesterase
VPLLELDADRHIHYQLIHGDKEKPYLVFLHEGLGCVAMWGDFPQRVCATSGCPGLVYDRSGYGNSSPLAHKRTIHYLHEYALIELPLLLQAVIPDTPFIVIGHSDGGSIGLIYGAERSPLLQGIITEAAHVFVEPETIAGVSEADKAWEKGKLRGLLRYHGAQTETLFKAWSETWRSNWFKWWNIEYLLPSIDVPLLVIQGRDDQYGSERQVTAIVAKSGGPAQAKLIEQCAHVPHQEAEDEVAHLMCAHIARMRAGLPMPCP